ncbi:MAG TPA: argininosuccinate lyase [Patescibacteria group bacterium]
MKNKLWGHSFQMLPSKAMMKFTTGRDVQGVEACDIKLLPYDIWLNQAHVLMLVKQKIIKKRDAKFLFQALNEIESAVAVGELKLDPMLEDVHTNIETWVTAKHGVEIAGKLHTARSRNDQVATDTRLYLRDVALGYTSEVMALINILLENSHKYSQFLCPGFTHHQHAMVTTFGHILLAFATMLLRDVERFQHWMLLHNQNPLGSVASYGTQLAIDREYTSQLLAFDGPTLNSIDPIMSRWEAEADLTFAFQMVMNHLSSLAQTLIIFSMPEFGFITLTDEFSTGSSIMPQKKNPDPLEVMKGKTSVVTGTLTSLLGIGKANFIGYNRDTQWTKYQVMDVVDECWPAPKVMQGVIQTMTVDQKKIAEQCHQHFIGATSLLESFSQEYHVPFRLAKIVTEKAIAYSENKQTIMSAAFNKALKEAGLGFLVSQKKIEQWQNPLLIMKKTKVEGGPGLESQQQARKKMSQKMATISNWLEAQKVKKYQALLMVKSEGAKLL